MRSRSILFLVLAVLCLAGGSLVAEEANAGRGDGMADAADSYSSFDPKWEPDGPTQGCHYKYGLHKDDYPGMTEIAYCLRAQDIVDPRNGFPCCHGADGTAFYWDPTDGTVVIVGPEGLIITMFRPSDGSAYVARECNLTSPGNVIGE